MKYIRSLVILIITYASLFIMIASGFVCFAKQGKTWNDFKKAKQNNKTPNIPDFSYSGYKCSEEAIPEKHDLKIFNILDYGAVADDTISNKKAILNTIDETTKNNGGIIFCPKSRSYINTKNDVLESIKVSTSNIILKGEGEKSILFFENDLLQKNPKKFWTCLSATKTYVSVGDKFLTRIIKNRKREINTITVESTELIKKDDLLVLKVENNSKLLKKYNLEPIKHHRFAQDDTRWNILKMTRAADSWVEDYTFKNRTNTLTFRNLILWNFKETDEAEESSRFWLIDTCYWKIVPPIIVGFHGLGTTFKEGEVQILENNRKPAKPKSLFEEQLKLRLGILPKQIINEKLKIT